MQELTPAAATFAGAIEAALDYSRGYVGQGILGVCPLRGLDLIRAGGSVG